MSDAALVSLTWSENAPHDNAVTFYGHDVPLPFSCYTISHYEDHALTQIRSQCHVVSDMSTLSSHTH